MKRLFPILLAVVLVFCLVFISCASPTSSPTTAPDTDKVFKLKFSHFIPPVTWHHGEIYEPWAQEIEEEVTCFRITKDQVIIF
ncbi:hypothetical protein ACFLYM_02185 [Chloroflexota bacterium]